MLRLLICGFAEGARLRRAAHFIDRAKREKSEPARIAAVSRRVQRPEKPPQPSFCHLSLPNVLQFKVPASRAVRMSKGGQGHRSSVKSALAPQAAPRPQRRHRHQPIHGSPSVRSHTTFISARWTIHRSAASRRRIHNPRINFNRSFVLFPRYTRLGCLPFCFFVLCFSASLPLLLTFNSQLSPINYPS